MKNDLKVNRRRFLATAATATSSTVAFGLSAPGSIGHSTEKEMPPANVPFSFGNLYDPSIHATTLKGEAADRLALRRLVDAWAHCADRRLAEQQSNLFVPDGQILNYEGDTLHSTIKGRAAIETALGILKTFTTTLHMNGQSDVVIREGEAIGETYCIVHQFTISNEQRKCQTLGIRYLDQFLRQEGRWYFRERKLIVDWSDSRISVP